MLKPGFVPILLVIPVVIIALSSFVYFESKIHSKKSPPPVTVASPTASSSPTPEPTPSSTPSPSPTPAPTPKPAPTSAPSPQNSSSSSISSGGNYSVLTFSLGGSTVVTDTATDDDCNNNCPAKPLAQYVSENGGRGGMNGTYFCPPDYSWCSGKVNTFDFPVWNNRKRKWMQANKLFWNGRGMMVFRPGSAQFFPCAACVGAPSDITGGITNYPSLIAGGQVVYNNNTLADSDKLKTTRGTRNGIGFGGSKLFLVVASNANMDDLVNIFKSLGATDAMNTDGGGSSALYENGSYKVGPGRSLPNAVIVK